MQYVCGWQLELRGTVALSSGLFDELLIEGELEYCSSSILLTVACIKLKMPLLYVCQVGQAANMFYSVVKPVYFSI